MQFNESTPRAEITVQDQTFSCPQPYGEGHTLTANEATALNQLLCENLRNNVAAKVKAGLAEGGTPFTQADFDAYAAEYEFGVRRTRAGGGEARLPPEQREARKIAKEKILEALRAKGIKTTSVGAEKMEELVSNLSTREDIVKEAEARVKRLSKIGLDSLGLDDLMDGEPQAAAA